MAKADPPAEHAFRSHCSIARTLDLLGDRWTLLIVRDLLWNRRHTFQQLETAAERVPASILADRLRRLQAWGLMRRERYQDHPPRYTYTLTERGRALEPVLRQMMDWGHRHLGGGLFDPESGERRA